MTGHAPASAARTLPLEPGGTVEIAVSSGDVRLRGTDGDHVVVRRRDGDPLGDDVALEAEPGLVRIRGGHHVDLRLGPVSVRTGGSPDLDIELPSWAAVALRTLSGDVVAAGIGGASRWASASGDLRISTSAGPVQLQTMSGDATLECTAAIDVGARTVSGDVRIRAPRLEASEVTTTSGDIRLQAELAATGRHTISSVSGDVEIATPSPVRLEAQTIAGDVRAEGPHTADGGRGRRTLVVGDGSVAVSVRTTSGDVRLRAATSTSSGAASAPEPASAPESALAPERPAAPDRPAAPQQPVAPEPPTSFAPQPPFAPEPPTPVAGPGVRPISDEDTQSWSAGQPLVDRREAARLDILRALERGDLDLETASRRLEILEESGPRYFRGWC